MARRRYNVEYNSAETGDEVSKPWLTYTQLETLLISAEPGDDIVIHVVEGTTGEL